MKPLEPPINFMVEPAKPSYGFDMASIPTKKAKVLRISVKDMLISRESWDVYCSKRLSMEGMTCGVKDFVFDYARSDRIYTQEIE